MIVGSFHVGRVTHFVWIIDWGMEDIHEERCSSTYFRLHALGGDSSVLSLQFLEEKQHLGGEDCNIPSFSTWLNGILKFFFYHLVAK